MKLISLLTLIRDILYAILDIVKRVSKAMLSARVRKALKQAQNEGDQRGVEKELSGAPGRSSKHKYRGMRTQKAKKRR